MGLSASVLCGGSEKEQVFGIIGNVGTPTGAVGLPYALERKILFFTARQ
jgi:hypothetical protein